MSKTRSKHGSNRLVVQLSDENFIALHTALTPPGEVRPAHGAISKFINMMMDEWRARRALETTEGVSQ
jgi:predicted RNA-binding protein with PUA domain